jgi:hypothetical protein
MSSSDFSGPHYVDSLPCEVVERPDGLKEIWVTYEDGYRKNCNGEDPVPHRLNNYGKDLALPVGEERWYDSGYVHMGKGLDRLPAVCQGVGRPRKDITAKDIMKEHDAILGLWKSSPFRKHLLGMIERNKPERGWTIDNAICLGPGTFSREEGCTSGASAEVGNTRGMFQLVMFLDVVDHLRYSCPKLQIVVQDTLFTPMDREFLKELGVETVDYPVLTLPQEIMEYDGPDVVKRITPNSFVCELCVPEKEGLMNALIHEKPALVIGTMPSDMGDLADEIARHDEKQPVASSSDLPPEVPALLQQDFTEGAGEAYDPEALGHEHDDDNPPMFAQLTQALANIRDRGADEHTRILINGFEAEGDQRKRFVQQAWRFLEERVAVPFEEGGEEFEAGFEVMSVFFRQPQEEEEEEEEEEEDEEDEGHGEK